MTGEKKSVLITGAKAIVGHLDVADPDEMAQRVGEFAAGSHFSPGWLTRLVNKRLAHS